MYQYIDWRSEVVLNMGRVIPIEGEGGGVDNLMYKCVVLEL